MNGRILFCAMTLLGATALFSPLAAGTEGSPALSWRTHELDFQYRGFTSRYSCDALEGDMREVLLSLGARDDKSMVVSGICSGTGNRPSRIAGVHIKVATLQPAADVDPATPVNAYWKPVTIGGWANDMDCELLSQIKNEILPLFTTRNVQGRNIDCFPHVGTLITSRLTLEVLAVPAPGQ